MYDLLREQRRGECWFLISILLLLIPIPLSRCCSWDDTGNTTYSWVWFPGRSCCFALAFTPLCCWTALLMFRGCPWVRWLIAGWGSRSTRQEKWMCSVTMFLGCRYWSGFVGKHRNSSGNQFSNQRESSSLLSYYSTGSMFSFKTKLVCIQQSSVTSALLWRVFCFR